MQQKILRLRYKLWYNFRATFLIWVFLFGASLFAFSPGILANTTSPDVVAESGQFPKSAANTLRQDISQRVGIATEKMQLVEATPKTWADGCLGLAKPDELCSQALVEGWQVTLSDGNQRWSYHTNINGQIYRLVETLR